MASPTSTLSPTTAIASSRNPQRPPPPSLFLGPPSNNASNISLPSLRQTTSRPQPGAPLLLRRHSSKAPDASQNQNIAASYPRPTQQQRQQFQHQNEGDRTDALWAEMQATLAEVELSAARGTHFFGPEHSATLEELRIAQIALAQAWARSEADEIIDHPSGHDEDAHKVAGASKDGEKGKSLEEQTEADILLGRKRREANDRYFKRVNLGVLDVVGRLEEVAVAMQKVERESREIWSESESMITGSSSS